MRLILIFFLLTSLGCENTPMHTTPVLAEKKVEHKIKNQVFEKKTDTVKAWTKITRNTARERLTDYGNENQETRFTINTEFGAITIELYKDTPLHRANMILMVKEKILDGSNFYRISKDFLAQAGLTSSSPGAQSKMNKIGPYKVPQEIKDKYPHVRGAFAMAGDDMSPGRPRNDNSDPYSFYIVEGAKQTDESLRQIENIYGHKISDKNKSAYKKYGGAPHLDNSYSVIGRVVKGLDIIDKMSEVEVNSSHHPLKNIYITLELAL